jgi:hypothetical protein
MTDSASLPALSRQRARKVRLNKEREERAKIKMSQSAAAIQDAALNEVAEGSPVEQGDNDGARGRQIRVKDPHRTKLTKLRTPRDSSSTASASAGTRPPGSEVGNVGPDGNPAPDIEGTRPTKKGSAGECRDGQPVFGASAKVGAQSGSRGRELSRRVRDRPGNASDDFADGPSSKIRRNVSIDAALMLSFLSTSIFCDFGGGSVRFLGAAEISRGLLLRSHAAEQ